MPRNGQGVYVLPTGNPVVPFTVIESQWANTTMSDLGDAITQSIAANGVTTPSANLPMGGFRHTGVGLATSPTQYSAASQVQAGEFQTVTGTANVGDAYTGTLPFSSGNAVAPVIGQLITLIPSANNVGASTLALSGGIARPILNPLGGPTGIGALKAGIPSLLSWNGSAWVQEGAGAAGVNTITTSDAQVLSASQPTPGNSLLTSHTNVSNGMVKLDAGGKIPPDLFTIEGMTLLGIWNAAPGNLPPNGTVSGQYYVINPGGNLNLFVTDGGTGWVQQVVPVSNGDMILWVSDAIVEPTGWYRVIRANANDAADIVNIATPSFVATDLQAWIDQADSTSGFTLANGSRPFTSQVYGPFISAYSALGINARFDGANWRAIVGGTWSAATSTTAGVGTSTYLSTTQPVAAGDILTLVEVMRMTPSSVSSLGPNFAVGGLVRQPLTFAADFYGTGPRLVNVADTATGLAVQVGVDGVNGGYIRNVRQQNDGSAWPVAGLPFVISGQDNAGALRQNISISALGFVQIGLNSQPVPGAIGSTFLYFGAVNGPLDMKQVQTAGIQAGSTVTSISIEDGQACRIFVLGGGSVTLPGTIKLPKSGAQYGTASTIIGLLNCGGTTYSTFTPYDT